jgi:hypothetical protein
MTVLREWRQDHYPTNPTEAWLDEFFDLLSDNIVELIAAAAASQAGTLVAMTAISIGDTLSDFVVVVTSFYTLSYSVAVTQAMPSRLLTSFTGPPNCEAPCIA